MSCCCVNCQTMGEQEIVQILRLALEDFPLRALQFELPDWLRALPTEDPLQSQLMETFRKAGEGAARLRDREPVLRRLEASEWIEELVTLREDLGRGTAQIRVQLPQALYYRAQRTGARQRRGPDPGDGRDTGDPPGL